MHNGAYDCSYFIRDLCPPRNYLYDSMLMWYSRFSELPKTLDFVSSILIDDYQYWKDDIKGTDNKDQVLGNLERYWRYNALDTRKTLFNTISEEHRVGKECVITCRTRWSPMHKEKKKVN